MTKRFLACLLMLAIPLQGFAASAMIFCTLSTHAASTYEVPATQVHTHSHKGAHLNPAVHDHAEHAKTEKSGHAKCGVCTTCCLGALIATPLLLHHAAIPQSERIVFTLKLFANHSPEALDPPPKSSLA